MTVILHCTFLSSPAHHPAWLFCLFVLSNTRHDPDRQEISAILEVLRQSAGAPYRAYASINTRIRTYENTNEMFLIT